MSKKLLYNFWGYLSDKKGISSPDGNFIYTPWILDEFMKRGWKVYGGPIDRDKELVDKFGKTAFNSFSTDKRFEIYNNLKFVDMNNLPEIDLLFLEWRFPTKSNMQEGSPDLDIQNKLIDHYQKKGTKIVVFDLDYKFTEEDESKVRPWKTLETSLKPKRNHTSVFIPFDFEQLGQFPIEVPHLNNILTYVGNNYEREFDFNNKLIPASNFYPGNVHLIGNWMGEKSKEFRETNKNIKYHDRIDASGFRNAYKNAMLVPLLAKEEYKQNGYMTARIIESLFWGSLPLGFSDFYGINEWLPEELIVDMNDFEKSFKSIVERQLYIGYLPRRELRDKVIKNVREKHGADKFVDKVLEGFEK